MISTSDESGGPYESGVVPLLVAELPILRSSPACRLLRKDPNTTLGPPVVPFGTFVEEASLY